MNWTNFLRVWAGGLSLISVLTCFIVMIYVTDRRSNPKWWLLPALTALGAIITGSIAAGLVQ